MTFNFIDIIFIVIILFFAVTACVSGLIRELFGKLAVVAGAVAAFFFSGKLSPYLFKIINNKTVDLVIAFLLIFIAVFLFVKIIQILFKNIFSGEILKSLDHVLGFIFGAIEGVAIVSCVLILLEAQIWFDASSLIDGSTISSFLIPVLQKPIGYIHGMFV